MTTFTHCSPQGSREPLRGSFFRGRGLPAGRSPHVPPAPPPSGRPSTTSAGSLLPASSTSAPPTSAKTPGGNGLGSKDTRGHCRVVRLARAALCSRHLFELLQQLHHHEGIPFTIRQEL